MLPSLHGPLYWSIKLDYQYAKEFCLVERDGVFAVADVHAPLCHPLETALVNEPVAGDASRKNIRNLLAQKLGVSVAWVDGFCDAYRGSSCTPSGPDYLQGFREGGSAELRKLTD